MKNQVGVVIARFQSPKLHHGHMHVLNIASNNSETLCVLLGDHGGMPTDKNPLDFITRQRMIAEVFPKAEIFRLPDMIDDHAWSKKVDEILSEHFPSREVVLYGSRESFLPYYSGIYKTEYIQEINHPSATTIREVECSNPRSTYDFRAGAIYSALNRYPIVFSTVDIAVVRKVNENWSVLLGQKKGDGGKCRFIGGFVDVKDKNHEAAALRELHEEVGYMKSGPLAYCGSYKVDDFRYHASKDSVLTTLFITEYESGLPIAKDDLDGLIWVPVLELPNRLIECHLELGAVISEKLNVKQSKN